MTDRRISSELAETLTLLGELMELGAAASSSSEVVRHNEVGSNERGEPDHSISHFSDPPAMAGATPPVPLGSSGPSHQGEGTRALSRAERLEDALIGLCRRAGIMGAVLSDGAGLPISAYNAPLAPESVAALTSVLAETLRQSGRLLERNSVNHVSVDVDYEKRLVLRRFGAPDRPFYLMVLCTQSLDERSEIELTTTQLLPLMGTANDD